MYHSTLPSDVLERFFSCIEDEPHAVHVPTFMTRSLKKNRQNSWKLTLPQIIKSRET